MKRDCHAVLGENGRQHCKRVRSGGASFICSVLAAKYEETDTQDLCVSRDVKMATYNALLRQSRLWKFSGITLWP